MRYLLCVALALVAGVPGSVAVQTAQSDIWITITPSGRPGGSASVPARGSEIYIDGPAVGVGVPGQESAPQVMFTMRAWREKEKARVVVYARLQDKRAPGGSTETPIAT